MCVRPFQIQVLDSAIQDLRERIAKTRWPCAIEGERWDYGTDFGYMRRLATYWVDQFNWRTQERALNDLPQVVVSLGDQEIHAFHVRSHRADAVPLLLCHGWPGGNTEFAKIAENLANPPDAGIPAFHVVAPAMPGYGFRRISVSRG